MEEHLTRIGELVFKLVKALALPVRRGLVSLSKGAARAVMICIAMMPFVGRLDIANWDAWKKSTIQTVLSVVLSSAPIWLSTAALLIDRTGWTLPQAIAYSIRNGELLLLSAGAVSPLIYLTTFSAKGTKPAGNFVTSFPHGAFYLLAVVIILPVCAVFVSLRAVHAASGDTDAAGSLYPWSLWIYLFCLFLYFTATFHRHSADSADPAYLIRPGEAEFQKAWSSRG